MCHGEILLARYDLWHSTDVLYSPTEQRKVAGMIVDMDNGVDLNDNVVPDKEPKDRTVSRGLNRAYTCDTHERATPCQGTPTYCARSVAVGQYVVTFKH